MRRKKYLFVLLFILLLTTPFLSYSQEEETGFFICQRGLVGLTYQIHLPKYGFVCSDFISEDTVIVTYAEEGSFPEEYILTTSEHGKCVLIMGIPYPLTNLFLEFFLNDKYLVGVGMVGIRPTIFFPVTGQKVDSGECQPHNP